MKGRELSPSQSSRLSEWIVCHLGLQFPPERWSDLERGMAGAAREFGCDDAPDCARWLLASPPSPARLQVLASHLTIGESYFFRDPGTLDAVARSILPALVRARQGGHQRLRIWCAACSTGEEAYTLAILLHEALPDRRGWQVEVNATDINPRSLQKAAQGQYGEWSFRGVPAPVRERYFKRGADGRFEVDPSIRKLVNFSSLNLVDPACDRFARANGGFDLIFCRNTLMYFSPAQARKAVGYLYQALGDGGWLAVSPSEASRELLPQFEAVNLAGSLLFRKANPEVHAQEDRRPATVAALPLPAQPDALPVHPATDPATCLKLARTLANQGELALALVWCDLWLAAEKLDAAGHYLRAVILLELGKAELARVSLLRAIYLEPDLVLAHFALGNLALGRGQRGEADRHFANAQRLLVRHPPGELLPESDGLTAGRLAQTLAAMTSLESTA